MKRTINFMFETTNQAITVIKYILNIQIFRYIQAGILDYLREGFSLACPAIQTYGVHVVYTHTFRYSDGTAVSYCLQGVAVSELPPHIFYCRYRSYKFL